jgi:hypothetical protein
VISEGILVDPLVAWREQDAWRLKLEADANQIARCLPAELEPLHGEVVERARAAEARTLILSGSTVRAHRTEISDLDYHLVGSKIQTKDLSRQLDLHVLSREKLKSEVLAGDDFIQWSLRFGCVVFDDGTARRALQLIAEQRPWPDIHRKRGHAAKSLELADRFVGTGDEDGAVPQVRAAISLASRARLLSEGVFPLSRAELPGQLEAVGCRQAAHALTETIHATPSLADLAAAVRLGYDLISTIGSSTTGASDVRPNQGGRPTR